MKNQAHYFNTAATGIVPAEYIKANHQFLKKLSGNPANAFQQWMADNLQDLRNSTASFLDAEPDEIAFIPNFSYGLNALVHSLKPLKKVMVLYEDYPSVADPFLLNGFKVHRFKSPRKIHFNTEDIIVEMLAKQVEILAISHVQWLTGFRVDLEKLGKFCRERNIVFIVDGTQSMGAIPLSLKQSGADVIISSGYKWMNAGFGTGIICARKDFLKRHLPKIRGNNSRMLSGEKWTDNTAIIGYEPGHLNVPGLIILQHAVADKLKTGSKRIFEHNMQLTRQFMDEMDAPNKILVGPQSTENRSSIVSLKGGELLFNHLSKKGLELSFRNGLVRLSFHYYNTPEAVDELVTTINQF